MTWIRAARRDRARRVASIAIAVGLLAALGAAATAALAAGSAVASGSPTVSIFAGGPGGPALATTVAIGSPCGLTSSGQTLLMGTAAHAQVFDVTEGDQTPGVVRAVSARSGQLTEPSGLRVDSSGNALVAEAACGFRVRLVADKNGTFYGQKIRTGDIYTIAGPGHGTCSGNGRPATAATIGGNLELATDHSGDTLLLTPGKQCRLRLVAGQTRTIFGAKRLAGHIYTDRPPENRSTGHRRDHRNLLRPVDDRRQGVQSGNWASPRRLLGWAHACARSWSTARDRLRRRGHRPGLAAAARRHQRTAAAALGQDRAP